MPIRAVLFDNGGVLLRTEYQAPREALAERLNLTYEDLVKIVFNSESSRQASLGAKGVDDHWITVARKVGRPAAEARQIRDEFFAGDILDRDLLDFIRSLRPRYKTGLITNAWLDAREFLRQSRLEELFDVLVISAEVGVVKPEPQIYRIALEQLKVQAGEAVFIDDMPVNVEGAQAVGMHGLLFQDRSRTLDELNKLLK